MLQMKNMFNEISSGKCKSILYAIRAYLFQDLYSLYVLEAL